MNSDEALATARDVQSRDLTQAQEAVVVALAEAAIGQNEDPMDAAEMLVSAAVLVILREHGPAMAHRFFEGMAAIVEVTVKEHVQ